MLTSLALIFLAGLSLAVLAIIITAPLGALGIDTSFRRLLQKERD